MLATIVSRARRAAINSKKGYAERALPSKPLGLPLRETGVAPTQIGIDAGDDRFDFSIVGSYERIEVGEIPDAGEELWKQGGGTGVKKKPIWSRRMSG
jgi:hypothetical protein